ncbi:hypothetical protein [Rhodococcus sp. ACS1]|uniref:hypothetical protein n=1 Tax=Rhodococcus sp. ACS1 TaxID=2028570 RepID=UPI00117ADDB1|nr:hypothetical protein [Rhodococcus sp. ACS1]
MIALVHRECVCVHSGVTIIGRRIEHARHLIPEQRLERFGLFDPDVVLLDVDLLEECLVEQTPDVVISPQIGGIAVHRVAQGRPEVLLHQLKVHHARLQAGFHSGQLGCDPVLLGFQQIEGHRACVVSLEQPGALVQQALPPSIQLLLFAFGGLLGCAEIPP